MTWVLDTSAVICWLEDEPGAERVRDILAEAEPAVLHAVNLVEVQYYFARLGDLALERTHQQLRRARVEVSRSLDDEILTTATRLKAFHAPIALGDVFAVALAVHRGATLLTTDRGELEKIASAGLCSVEFLR